MNNSKEVIPVELSDGSTILLEYLPTGREKVAGRSFSFENISKTIRSLATDLRTAVADAKPTKTTVEFGVTVSAESGGLTALIVKGSGEANLKITLEWENSKDKDQDGR